MNNTMKKRGSVWRCISPLLIYFVLQNAAGVIVMVRHLWQNGFFNMRDISSEELMNRILTSTFENINMLNFFTMIVGYVILIPIFLYMHRRDLAGDQIYGVYREPAKVPVRLYGLLLAAGAASCLAASNMISMSGLIKNSESYASAVEVLYSAGLVPELLALGVLAPIGEELLFRGLIYRRLKEFVPLISSMVWASLIFALLHGNLVQGIYAFISGLLFCYVYERYGSVKAPILMHMFSNITAVIASETGILNFMYSGKIMFYAVTFICCLLVVAVIYLIEMYVRPLNEAETENTELKE